MADIYYVHVNKPPIGGKAFVIDKKGIFVFERGATLLRTIACTHAGTGGATVYDGIPDDDGFFPDEKLTEDDPNYYNRNGRPLFTMHPSIMGSWALDGGAIHGLTVKADGGTDQVNAVITIVWISLSDVNKNA
jgi:hypothetical protein